MCIRSTYTNILIYTDVYIHMCGITCNVHMYIFADCFVRSCLNSWTCYRHSIHVGAILMWVDKMAWRCEGTITKELKQIQWQVYEVDDKTDNFRMGTWKLVHQMTKTRMWKAICVYLRNSNAIYMYICIYIYIYYICHHSLQVWFIDETFAQI